MDNRPIGVFDSGVGGLSITKEILACLPNEQIIYFGDTLRTPYGNKEKKTITYFSKQICRFLIAQDVKAIVIACNTICVSCYEELANEFPVPFIEIIGASVEETLRVAEKNVGLFATIATINSEEHKTQIKTNNPDLFVFGKACPLFLPIVEEGFAQTDIAYLAALEYSEEFKRKKIDTLILGCTHYSIMKERIKEAFDNDVVIVDPSYAAALKLKSLLEAQQIFRDSKEHPSHKFYFSGDKQKFTNILHAVLAEDFYCEKINIDKF